MVQKVVPRSDVRFASALGWLAVLLPMLCGGSAHAQQRPGAAAAPDAVVAGCRNVTNAATFADCVGIVQRFIVESRRIARMHVLDEIYKDLVGPGWTLSCDSALRNAEIDVRNVGNIVGFPLGWQPRDCQDVAQVYRAAAGIPVAWASCPIAAYSYEHFEACIIGALESRNEVEALARLYGRVTRNASVDRPGFSMAEPLPQASQTAQRMREHRLRTIQQEAKQCVATGGTQAPLHLAGSYRNLATGGARRNRPDYQRESTERFAAIKCPEAVRLAVRLKMLDDTVHGEYAKAQAAKQKERAAQAAWKCSAQRAQTPPSRDDLEDAMRAYVLDNCATLPVALRALSGGAGPDSVAVGAALMTFKRGSHACTMTNFALKVEMAWHEVSRHNCTQVADRSYACNVTGRMSCNSDDYNRMRNDVFCSLYTREQTGAVLATFDQRVCEWNVVPRQN